MIDGGMGGVTASVCDRAENVAERFHMIARATRPSLLIRVEASTSMDPII
jgi:hypothetical protein